jgi:hypothetical protein
VILLSLSIGVDQARRAGRDVPPQTIAVGLRKRRIHDHVLTTGLDGEDILRLDIWIEGRIQRPVEESPFGSLRQRDHFRDLLVKLALESDD